MNSITRNDKNLKNNLNSNQPSYNAIKELEKWDERVIYNVKFNENSEQTHKILNRLDEILFKSLEKFTTIAATSESLTYKIGRYFISKDVKNDSITFIDGKIIESYIGDNSPEWKKKDRVDEFFEIFSESCKNKWVICPLISFEITIGLAIYFITKLRKTGAIGLIFFGEGPNNLAEILALNIEDPNFYEFPMQRYRRRKRVLPEDEW